MKNRNKAKGAFVVEFALTLPMYIGVTFSAIFGSLMLHDEYVLQTTTQNLAREFAIDAASSVQTNAQTGIVYGNAVNSILKYRKTLDDKLYLYKTTNEQGKQCTISIECNAKNVEGSSGVMDSKTYKMYKLDSAYIVLKGKIVPKEDLIPRMVQPVCPNLLDTMRKTRVELNINASLISKNDIDSEGGSAAEGILHSQEYTADYGDYDLSEGTNTGDTGVDNTPDFNAVNPLIAENKLYSAAKPSGYNSDYNNKVLLESSDFPYLLYDLLNTPALEYVLLNYLNNGNSNNISFLNLINSLYNMGYIQTNQMDFFYSLNDNTSWNNYLAEYLKNYLQLPAGYSVSINNCRTLVITDGRKSDLEADPDISDLLKKGYLIDGQQYIFSQYTIKDPDGKTQTYFAVFSGNEMDALGHNVLTKDYVEQDPAAKTNGLEMQPTSGIFALPDDDNLAHWNPSSNFYTDISPTHTQLEGEYMASGNIYYQIENSQNVIADNTSNRWVEVSTDGSNNDGVIYSRHSLSGVDYYLELENVDTSISSVGKSWSDLSYDIKGGYEGVYKGIQVVDSSGTKVTNYIKVESTDEGLIAGTWKNGFYYDSTRENSAIYHKGNDGYYELESMNNSWTGANWSKPDAKNLCYDLSGNNEGAYALINGYYYKVKEVPVNSPGSLWNSVYYNMEDTSSGPYIKAGSAYYKIASDSKWDRANPGTTWQTVYYNPESTDTKTYIKKANTFFALVDKNQVKVAADGAFGNVYYDTTKELDGYYVKNSNVLFGDVKKDTYYKIADYKETISKNEWNALTARAGTIYYDTNYSVDNGKAGYEGAYATVGVSGVTRYYQINTENAIATKTSTAAGLVKNNSDGLYYDSVGKAYIVVGDANNNGSSFYEVKSKDYVLASDGVWRGFNIDTRMTHVNNPDRYYRNTLYKDEENKDVYAYTLVNPTVGSVDSDGKPIPEPWTLIYNNYRPLY